MSMLSALCDELRVLAESVGLEVLQAIAATLGDADATATRHGDADLNAENAKLRELVKEMLVCLEDECKRCHEWGDTCDLEQCMTELGIEVEE